MSYIRLHVSVHTMGYLQISYRNTSVFLHGHKKGSAFFFAFYVKKATMSCDCQLNMKLLWPLMTLRI
jgi:hypothetical protein